MAHLLLIDDRLSEAIVNAATIQAGIDLDRQIDPHANGWATVSELEEFLLTMQEQWGTTWTSWSYVSLPPQNATSEQLEDWLAGRPDPAMLARIQQLLGQAVC